MSHATHPTVRSVLLAVAGWHTTVTGQEEGQVAATPSNALTACPQLGNPRNTEAMCTVTLTVSMPSEGVEEATAGGSEGGEDWGGEE